MYIERGARTVRLARRCLHVADAVSSGTGRTGQGTNDGETKRKAKGKRRLRFLRNIIQGYSRRIASGTTREEHTCQEKDSEVLFTKVQTDRH